MKKIRYIPYGYTMKNGMTVVASEEADVIRSIFQAYAGGASLKDIADELTKRKIPYSERTSTWDKARIARIITNKKYIGADTYEPIVDRSLFETAISLKASRQRNTSQYDNCVIPLIKNYIRCAKCGAPMSRRTSTKHRIRESWNCANPGCGNVVRISDRQLLSTITLLLNRIILNVNLLQPNMQAQKEADPKIIKVNNEIARLLESDRPDEESVIRKTLDLAAMMYEQYDPLVNLKVAEALEIVRHMKVLEVFDPSCLESLVTFIALDENGRVALHTITETEVTPKDGDNQNPEENRNGD